MENKTFASGKTKSDLLLQFSERLREIIGNKSLRQFSRECDISDAVLRRYLAASSEPGVTVVIKIAEAAGISVEWLATGRGPKTYDAQPEPVASQQQSMVSEPKPAPYGKPVPTEIPPKIVKQMVDSMVEHGMYQEEWRVAAIYFADIYNKAIAYNFSKSGIDLVVLESLLQHFEMSIANLTVLANKDDMTDDMQPMLEHYRSSVKRIRGELEALRESTAKDKSKIEIKGGGNFSF